MPSRPSGRLIRRRLALDLHRQLAEAGIELPFPQRVVHLKSEKTEAAKG